MEAVFRKLRLLCALTTLDPGEFERLLAAFAVAWQEQRNTRTHHGQTRQRQPGAGHKGTLVTPREKLFFVCSTSSATLCRKSWLCSSGLATG